jgi:gliding motility-associated-like protein
VFSAEIISLPVVNADFDLTYECNEDLEITINDNSESYTELSWDFGNGEEPISGLLSSFSYAEEGDYTIVLTASNPAACNTVNTYTSSIAVPAPPIVDFSTLPVPDCEVGVVQYQNLSFVSTYDDVLSWSWDFGDGSTSSEFASSHEYADQGLYNVSLTLETELGCDAFLADNISVGFLQKPQASFTYTIDSCSRNVTFMNQSELSDSYIWDLDGVASDEENPSMFLEVGNSYAINVIASNEFCSDEFSLEIDYSIENYYENVYVPNVITPNGDFKNDQFFITGLNECESAILRIYNRWGDEVYYSIDPNSEPWTGVNYSNELLEGVYFYILELKYMSITGDVSIFR